MAENNTTGAVHLTELSLDLTQFNENIRQIEQATAQVADVSVQNLSKIRDALNINSEQLTFRVDTKQFTQDISTASAAVKDFAENTRTAIGSLSDANIDSLLKGLNIQKLVDENGELNESYAKSKVTLESLRDALEKLNIEYSKIQVTTKDGDLFRAVVTSSDEAGRTIQNTFDLASESVENLGTKIVEKSAQSVKALNDQSISADELGKRFSDLSQIYSNFSSLLSESKIEGTRMDALVQRTMDYEEELSKTSTALENQKISVDSANSKYQEFLTTISVLSKEFNSMMKEAEKTSATSSISITADQINRLALGYANLSKRIETSKISDFSGMDELATKAKTAEEDLKRLAESLAKGNTSVERAAEVYKELSSELIQADIKFVDATRDLDSVVKENERIRKENTELVKSFSRVNSEYERLAGNVKKAKIPDIVKDDFLEKISKAQTGIAGLQQEIIAFGTVSAKDTYSPKYEEAAKSVKKLSERLDEAKIKQQEFLSDERRAELLADKYDRLQLSLAKLATDMAKQPFRNDELNALIEQAKQFETDAGNIANSLRVAGTASKEAERDFEAFNQGVKGVRQSFEHVKESATNYQNSLKPIQQQAQETSTALKALEKSAQFKTQKQEIANLRAEYDNFINRLKSAGMSAEEAKSELAGLDERFRSLQGSVESSNTVLGRFAARLGETIKWRIAHSAITLLMQSFGNLTRTIIDTEDAVIQLKRVLGDSNLVDSSMANALYDIAYTYGQTFDAVQEVAVKFAQTGMEWDDVLEATRVTMLGLNTAELEVSSATEGLIAIMAQFNIDAQDLETVIDKINITADNFPITSEKIVAALQRAGGTASAFGMSLEETIGVITALGKATGRAGEAIGTALNSLITFSMKDSALEKFSEFLGQDVSNFGVLELWKALSKEIQNGNDSIAKMMAQSEEFANLMDESIATAVGLEQEYNLALKEGNEITAEGKSIYATVGTYRQNYFIALLNNISTAIEAIYGMRDAVGYSMRENETAMEAFSKKWNQFIISAQELAIQFANSGFLDMMKVIVEIADGFLKITKNVGGLNTVLAITFALLYQIKKAQFHRMIANISDTFSTLRQAINVYNTAVSLSYTRTEALTMAMATFEITAAGVIGILGLLVTGVGWLIQKDKEAEEAAAQAREESIRAGNEAVKSLETTMQSYVAYKNTLDDTTATIGEVNDARENMMELLGIERDENGKLVKSNGEIIDSYEELDGVIKQLTEDEYALTKAHAQQALEAAKTNIEKSDTKLNAWDIGAAGSSLFRSSQSDVYWDMLRKNKDLLKEIQEILYSKPTPDNISEQVKKLSEALIYLQKNYDDTTLVSDKLYKSIVNQLETYKALEAELSNAQGGVNSLAEDFEHYVDAIDAATDSTEGFSISAEDLEKELKAIGDIMETLNGKVDEFQSAYQTLIGVIDEYNETGIMTADMLQSLLELEPEYIELLDIKDGVIQINDEKLQALIATNDDYMNQLVALTVAEEIDNQLKIAQAASAEGLTIAEYNLKNATENLTLSTYSLVQQFYNGEITAEEFRTAIANLGVEAGVTANNIATLTESVMDYTQSLQMFYSTSNAQNMVDSINTSINTARGSIGRYYTPSSSSKKSGSSSSKKEEDPFKAQKEALDEMLDAYEHAIKLIEVDNKKIFDSDKLKVNAEEIVAIYTQMQAKVHEMADAYRAADAEKYASEIRKMQNLWLDYEEKKAKAISDISGLLDAQEHEILLLEIANRKVVDPELQRKNAQQIVAINKKMQDEIHERADMLRDMGYKESSEYIRKLQEDWWRLQQENEKLMEEVYDDIVGTYENAINYLEHLFNQAEDNLDYGYMRNNLKKQMDYYVKIQETAVEQLKYLAEKGYDIASEEAQKWVDVFYEAGQAIKEISRQIAADILDPFDDFIDLADKFDIWEYMDFTKVDYLRDKLTALNKLFEEGTITAKQYNEELKSLSYAIYDAQRELFQKQQEEIEKAAQETIKAYNEQIKLLNKQKDGINDYYDELIKGYNKEIEAWEKRKEEASDYYDTLIDNLRDVEKANERINKQVDYYNERQKIITNLEQAQARSGVEWREKEIEYQQQLIDLDEDWRRTLEEWSIEDQIAALENLKETTLKDIELSIQAIRDTITAAQEAKQAALDAIDAEIKGIQEMIETVEEETEEAVAAIEEQIKDMSRTIAESIKNGVEDGLVDSKEELDKALVDGTNALLGFIDSNGKAMEAGVKEASANSYALYTAEFLEPYSDSVTEIASGMKDALAVGASEGAKEALSAFKTGFIEPLKSELSSLLSQADSAKAKIASAASSGSSSSSSSSGSKSTTSSGSSSKTTTSTGTASSVPSFKDFYEANTPSNWEKIRDFPKTFGTTNVFITNNNNSIESAANRTAQTLRNILG